MTLDGLSLETGMLYLYMEFWISAYFISLSLLYWHFFRAVFIGLSQHMWSNIVMQESDTLCQYCVTFRSYCQLLIKRVPENGQQKLTMLTAELWIFWHEHKFFFCMFWYLLLCWHCCRRLAKYGLH